MLMPREDCKVTGGPCSGLLGVLTHTPPTQTTGRKAPSPSPAGPRFQKAQQPPTRGGAGYRDPGDHRAGADRAPEAEAAC